MAIPPANPPPRYEPPPRRDSSETDDTLSPEPVVEPVSGAPRDLDPRRRGCLMVLGVAAAIGCIVSAGLAMSCPSVMQAGESQATRQIAAAYRTAASPTDEAEADDAALRQLEQLGDSGGITLLAFAVLSNRYNDALLNDGRIDVDELHKGMELVHDIVDGHGTIVLERYPLGR